MSREELDALLDEACSLALYLLEKNREFFPFAVAMNSEGGIRHVEGFTGTEQPSYAEVVELLESGMIAEARDGTLLACAVVKDIVLTPSSTGVATDAIAVSLEHRTDAPVICYLPYRFERDVLVPGDIVAERGASRIFGHTGELAK